MNAPKLSELFHITKPTNWLSSAWYTRRQKIKHAFLALFFFQFIILHKFSVFESGLLQPMVPWTVQKEAWPAAWRWFSLSFLSRDPVWRISSSSGIFSTSATEGSNTCLMRKVWEIRGCGLSILEENLQKWCRETFYQGL